MKKKIILIILILFLTATAITATPFLFLTNSDKYQSNIEIDKENNALHISTDKEIKILQKKKQSYGAV